MSNLPLVGSRFQNKQGHWYTVIDVKGCKDITVKFDHKSFVKKIQASYIKSGVIKLPSVFIGDIVRDKKGNLVTIVKIESSDKITFQWEDGYERTCQQAVLNVGTLMREEDSRILNPSIKIGDSFINAQGSVFIVKDYLSSSNITIEFDKPIKHTVKTNMANIKTGNIHNRYLPTLAGKGVIGDFKVDSSNKMYKSWSGMLNRVYSKTDITTYKGCSVADDWLHLSTFSDWFDKQVVQENWQLDKDLLVEGNKVYSENTCIFLPREINTFLTDRYNFRGEWPVGVTYHERLGKWEASCTFDSKRNYLGVFTEPTSAFNAYKEFKESCAKTLAKRWEGIIDTRGVEALLNFTVNIDD